MKLISKTVFTFINKLSLNELVVTLVKNTIKTSNRIEAQHRFQCYHAYLNKRIP